MDKATFYQKNYIDEIIVGNYDEKDVKILESVGYKFDEYDECPIEMRFFDGLSVATDDSGLVMRYPKLAEVEKNGCMQDAIYNHTCRTDANQFDVALTFGELEKYKMVADYDIWKLQGDNEDLDIWAIHTADGKFLFDVLDDDYMEMLNADIVDNGHLCGNPTDDQVKEWRAKYGILWTENFTKELVGA